MIKRALFIVVLLLVVSSVTLAGGYSPGGKSGGAQCQSTSVVVSQGTTFYGPGVAASGSNAGAAAYQVVDTPWTTTAQAATSNVKSSSFLAVLWGKASTYFFGAANTNQVQVW